MEGRWSFVDQVYKCVVSYESELKQWWKEDTGLEKFTESDLIQPRQFVLQLTDDETFENFNANVNICSVEENLPGADILEVVDFKSGACVYRWWVKIIEKIEEPEVQVTYNTKKQRLTQRKDILKSLLESDSDK
jgi:hypothetical protein